ncbi:MAG: hypothetical protein M5U34_06030 [Chloroflexi bacterium]|nr:hypothetical protein [Chloroflexota bacterium]
MALTAALKRSAANGRAKVAATISPTTAAACASGGDAGPQAAPAANGIGCVHRRTP